MTRKQKGEATENPISIELTTEAPAPQKQTTELQPAILTNIHEFKWNFPELKQRLLDGIQKYANLIVDDTNLEAMERTSREIASLRTQVNKFRISTKKALEEPAAEFDTEARELLSIIAQAEEPLKKQLLEYEDLRVAARETALMQFAWKTAVSLGVSDAT